MPSLRKDAKFLFIRIFLVIIILYAKKGLCNNLPGDSVLNIISDKSPQGTRFSVLIDHEESSEFESSFEEDENVESDEGTYVDPSKVANLYAEQARNYSKTTQEPIHVTPYTAPSRTTIAPPTCSGSCSDKEARESAALDSFRKQLLARLGMEHAPNVTGSQKIPIEILKEFCKSRYLPTEYCTGSTSNKSHEYQSDSPRHYDENDLDVFEEEGEVVQYMSSESRIFAFPNCKSFKFI